MKFIMVIFAISMISQGSWATEKMHYISTSCSDGSSTSKGFKFGYMFFVSDKSGEIQFSWSSQDDQYSCDATATVRFEEKFIHPQSTGCMNETFEIDLPEMLKVSESTISKDPLLKKYVYMAPSTTSIGYCSQGSKLVMTVEPLPIH